MTQIEETPLPGVGIRYTFRTEDDRTMGVVHHRSGRRELYVTDADDPDCVAASVNLTEGESHVLADVLGGSTVTQHVGDLAHQVEGLTIDWLTLEPGSLLDGTTIVEQRVHSRTGAYIVAILRDGEAIPAPDPNTRLVPGDVLVVVGTHGGVEALQPLLTAPE